MLIGGLNGLKSIFGGHKYNGHVSGRATNVLLNEAKVKRPTGCSVGREKACFNGLYNQRLEGHGIQLCSGLHSVLVFGRTWLFVKGILMHLIGDLQQGNKEMF